jgi:hypothetical protein
MRLQEVIRTDIISDSKVQIRSYEEMRSGIEAVLIGYWRASSKTIDSIEHLRKLQDKHVNLRTI